MLAARSADYLAQVASEITAEGGRALGVPTNLVDEQSVAALVATTLERFGRLDVLVNNAFRMDRGQPFAAVDLASWRKVYDVNVWGALGLTQACVPALDTSTSVRPATWNILRAIASASGLRQVLPLQTKRMFMYAPLDKGVKKSRVGDANTSLGA